MILVTVGGHFQPFDRLIKAADNYAAQTTEKVLIQKGVSSYECKYADSFDFCPKEKMSELLKEADIVVMQGGWGAMCECIDKGKRIIVAPRIEGIEHLHDQEQVVRKLDSLNCIIGLYDMADLPMAIEKARSFSFKQLNRWNANIIMETFESWFPPKIIL